MTDVTGSQGFADWIIEELAAEGADLGDELPEVSSRGERLMKQVLASSTQASYRRKFEPFERWCHSIGASALPARPATLAAYLLRLARQGTAVTEVEPEEAQEGALAASTMASVVAAVGAIHRNNGYDGDRDPSQHRRVRSLIGAYGRAHPHAVRLAHAFSLEELGLMCDRCLLPAIDRSRDITLTVLATHPLLDLNGLRLHQLAWDIVELPASDDPDAGALLHFGGRIGTIPIPADPTDPTICPVNRLRSWQTLTSGGPVFESRDKPGQPMSRPALVKRLHTLLATANLQPSSVRGELPRLSVTDRHQLVQLLSEPADLQLRDRALMALMWWSGQRAEAIARLGVADLRYHERHTTLRMHIRRSKTDQYGNGGEVALAEQPGFVACPVAATTDWLSRYAIAQGLTLADDGQTPRLQQLIDALAAHQLPLFPADNPTHRGEPLGYDGINGVAKKYAALAGITATETRRISSHGFRAGSTTEMLAQGISAEEIARHQLRSDTEQILRYNRPGNTLDATPTRNLANTSSNPETQSAAPAARDHDDGRRQGSK